MAAENNEKVEVQLAEPERKYVKVYHDFLDNTYLNVGEQMVFIALKSYVNFSNDSDSVYPSLKTICARAKLGEKSVRKHIDTLVKKGIVKKVRRGLTKTNLYTLTDSAKVWACEKVEDVPKIIKEGAGKSLDAASVEECIAKIEAKTGKKVILESREQLAQKRKNSGNRARKKNSFNDFQQNHYDMEALEKELVDNLQ